MKLRTKNTPPIGVYLPREHFNALVAILHQFADTENQIGETVYSQSAANLKEKIFRFGKVYSAADSENAALFLYLKEAAVLIELLTAYGSFFTESHEDFYADFKSGYEQRQQK